MWYVEQSKGFVKLKQGERFCCVRPGKVLPVGRPRSELTELTKRWLAAGALQPLGSLFSPFHRVGDLCPVQWWGCVCVRHCSVGTCRAQGSPG